MYISSFSRLLMATFFTVNSTFAAAFTQPSEEAAPRKPVQQIKSELDHMDPSKRQAFLKQAEHANVILKGQVNKVRRDLEKALQEPSDASGEYIVAQSIGYMGLYAGLMVFVNGPTDGPFFSKFEVTLGSSIFLGSALVILGAKYLGNKDLERQKAIYLSGKNIRLASAKLEMLNKLLEEETAQIELLKTYYPTAAK